MRKITGTLMTAKIPQASQFHFFLMPEETKLVLNFLAEQNCMFFSDRSSNSEPCECTSLDDLSQVFCCPRELSGEIKMHRSSDGVYFIERTTSPVIELDCSVLREKGLYQGRIYFRGGYWGREAWVAYPGTLYDIYKKVTSFMRKTLLTKEREFVGYISKGSQKYIEEGGCLRQ